MNVDASTMVLGIETSCDETAAALVMGGNDVISSVVSSQIEIHADFGGVVPEIASRAHLDALNPVIARAIVEAGVDDQRIDAVACTYGPGLIGALLIGVSAAKALALAWDVPFVARQPPRGAPLLGVPRRPDARVPARRAARVGRAHDADRDAGSRSLPHARPDDRRRRRRGVRQGRPLPRARLSRRPGDRRRCAQRRPRPRALPAGDERRSRQPRLQLQRAQDRGRQLRAQAPRRVVGGRRRLVPDGGRRRARHQGTACGATCGRQRDRAGRGRRRQLAAARGTARRLRHGRRARLPARAGRCAPTTRR